jgi:hypothetical protein
MPYTLKNASPENYQSWLLAIGENLTCTCHRQTVKQLLPKDKRMVVKYTHILRTDYESSAEGCDVCTIYTSTGGTGKTNPAQLTTSRFYNIADELRDSIILTIQHDLPVFHMRR